MKTKLFTFVALFFVSLGVASADNFRTFQMSDKFGKTMSIFIKIEKVQDAFDFDTRDIFNEINGQSTNDLIDISNLIKAEKEVQEDIPGL